MNFRVAHRRLSPAVSLVAMADVAFLLIVFLLATGGLGGAPRLAVDLPVAAGDGPSPARVAVTIGLARDGACFVDGRRVDIEDLEKALRPRLAAMRRPAVVVAADRGVPFGTVVYAMDTARRLGVERVEIAVEEPQ